MRSTLSRTALLASLAGLFAAGCGFASAPAKPSSSRPAPKQVYSVWEFDTIGELDQFLDIKGCEGWRLAEAFTRGEKLVAVLVADGEAPATNPACRPSP